jgi:amino acid transporter
MRPVPMMMMGVSASAGIYAFNGYGGVVYFGEEIRNARHSLAGVVYGALAIAAVAELVPMLGVIGGTHDLARLARSATPLPDFILAHGGPVLARVLSLGVALAIFNAMIAIALCGSRQLFATARDRCWPGWACHALERIHPRFGSPYIATLVFGAITLLLCLVPLNLLVLVNGNGNVAMYACLSLAAIAGRRHGVTAHSQARMRFYPAAPLCVLLALAGVVWADLLDPVAGRIGLLVTLSVLLTGAAYYQLHLRRSPDWAFRPPADDALHS